MTEYTAQCRHNAGQYLKAYINGISVIIDGYDDRECVTNPYLSADSARIFARGILALADEIDGGEVTEVDIRPKVGDRLRVTEERELLETSEPARSSRATYVEEARRLMDGTGADADHIIAVAQFLAADE